MAKAGRPSKYKPEFAEQLPALFAEGQSVAEVAVVLGVTRDTFYDWVKRYPKFRDAYELGKQVSEAWWSKLGREGASGVQDIQPTVWIFNMKNKFGWRDQPDSREEKQPINIQIIDPRVRGDD